MKKLFLFLSVAALLAGCAENDEQIIKPNPTDGVKFVGTIENSAISKVLTSNGVTTWKAEDAIGIFSVANGATAGTSISANVSYETSSDGISNAFAPSDTDKTITASDKYYAYYPYSATYLSAIKATDPVPAAAAGDKMEDYRYIYVASNATQAFVVDPTTGLSVSNNPIVLCGQGTAPVNAGDPVVLSFKPVLPILEFGFTGETPIYKVEFSYVGETTYDPAANNFITGKGVVDLSTGEFTTTNLSATAAKKGVITFRTVIADAGTATCAVLNTETPVRTQFVTGRMVATGGLKLTFYYDAAGTVSATKTIWASKTPAVSMYDDVNKKCKHIYQPIGVPSVFATAPAASFEAAGGSQTVKVRSTSAWSIKSKSDWIASVSPASGDATTGEGTTVTVTAAASTSAARTGEIVLQNTEGVEYALTVNQKEYVALSADYYSVTLADIDWSSSYIQYIKDASSNVIAAITKEYFGATVNKQGIVVYPVSAGVPVYTSGTVLVLTLDGDAVPTTDIHGGTVTFVDMTPTSVTYTAGTSVAPTQLYVKASDGTFSTTTPAGSVSDAAVVPYVLTTDVKSHSTVKIGTQIWLAEDYCVTLTPTKTTWADALAAQEPFGLAFTTGSYGYNPYSVGFSGVTAITPTGWILPSGTNSSGDFADAVTFAGGIGGLTAVGTGTNVSLLGLIMNGKISGAGAVTNGGASGFYWTSREASSKQTFVKITNVPAITSATSNNQGFAIRLIKE